MKKNFPIYIILIFTFHFSMAQREASHWFFGSNAGLDFSSGTAVADTNGSLNTLEGCASISDANGRLLFYTDGTIVWNRNHEIMQNGSPLLGNSSSTQSAIIVPKPGDLSIYFIFTVDWAQGVNGLNYYTVDMSLEGGLGSVIGSNNSPIRTNLISSPTSEKITAVKVLNEQAFWVISLKRDKFYVFKVDANGVSATPVINNDGFTTSADTRGYLKTSPDGTKLVSANMTSGTYLYDFDAATGTVSNERRLNILNQFAYGAEFSPLSQKLYISTGNYVVVADENGEVVVVPAQENLFQFNMDIANPTSANIDATRVTIHTYTNQRAALQLGLDGKIYRAINNKSFLGVINNPEEDGIAANYVHNAVSLSGKISQQGLPPFIQSFFAASIQVENACLGDDTIFTLNSNESIISVIWDFGDLSPPVTTTENTISHRYGSTGDYNLIATVSTADEVKIIKQTIPINNKPNINSSVTLEQCDDDNDGITLFNLTDSESLITGEASNHFFSYHYTVDDAENNVNSIINLINFSNEDAKQVIVRVNNQFACYALAELNLEVSVTQIPSDFIINFNECDNDLIDGDDSNGITSFNFSEATQQIMDLLGSDQDLVITYYENLDDALARQNEIDSNSYRNELSPFFQEIVVRVDNELNKACIGLGYHVSLTTVPLPNFDLLEHTYLCLNELPNPLIVNVDNPQGTYTYEWRNATGDLLTTNSTSILEVVEEGDYYVTAITEFNCQRTKKISIDASNLATVENVEIVDATENNSIDVDVSGEGDYEFALNDINGIYQDEGFFEIEFGGVHTVYIRDKNGCGIISDQVVVLNIPKFFTPNGDGYNDTWQVNGVFSQPGSVIYIFDRFGKVLNQINPTSLGWDGNYNGSPLPSSDYWYVVQLEDGRTLKGHFSLIRR